jgi:Na+/phosphate symporter
MATSGRSALASAVGLVIALVVVGALLYYFVALFRLVPPSLVVAFHVGVVIVLGYVAVVLVGRLLESVLRGRARPRHAGPPPTASSPTRCSPWRPSTSRA